MEIRQPPINSNSEGGKDHAHSSLACRDPDPAHHSHPAIALNRNLEKPLNNIPKTLPNMAKAAQIDGSQGRLRQTRKGDPRRTGQTVSASFQDPWEAGSRKDL
jgi:hypothetical protein